MPVRWTPYENLHLTLQFLGDVEEKRIPELKLILDQYETNVQDKLCFANTGAFPNPAAPRIIWLGFKKCQTLLNIQRKITYSLSEKGFPYDHKFFKPHLTIGRVRDNAVFSPESFAHIEDLAVKAEISDTPLDRITLFESQLRPGGPVYRVIHEKRLTGRI